MPFAQVVKDGDKKTLAPIDSIGGGGSGVDTVARNTANEAKAVADAAYPKTGGVLTGPLYMQAEAPHIWLQETSYDRANPPATQAARGMYAFHGLKDGVASELGGLAHLTGGGLEQIMLFMQLRKASGESKGMSCLKIVNPYDDDVDPYLAINRMPADGDCSGRLSTTEWVRKNCRTVRGSTQFHVGGPNASDTDDLYNGRGLTADKPFATLDAANAFVESWYNITGQVSYILHSDQVVNGRWFFMPHFWTTISSGETGVRRTLTMGPNFEIGAAPTCVSFSNIDFVPGEGRTAGLGTQGLFNPVYLDFGSCTFSGSTVQLAAKGPGARIMLRGQTTFNGGAQYALDASYGGNVMVQSSAESVVFNGAYSSAVVHCMFNGAAILSGCSGNATGKKFDVSNRSYVSGTGAIPGTSAGTCDASSFVS